MINQYHKLFDLSGKVAVVTGGAGILGKYFCSALAAYGAQVVIIDLNMAAAESLALEISENEGGAAIALGADLNDRLQLDEAVEKIARDLGPIDILHNNAATKGSDLSKFFFRAEDYPLDTWREVMGTNLESLFLVTAVFGSSMAKRGRGSIIHTGSIYGCLGPDQRIYKGSEYMGLEINTPPVYSASKAGVLGLTKYWATYWGHMGVRVNTLIPGGVRSGQNANFIRNYSGRVPLGRMAEPSEMVGALIYLASDASSYVTGQDIIVDGGLSAW